jgi:hypothetical protein
MTAVSLAARRAFPLIGASALAVVVGAELVRQPSTTRLVTAACVGLCAFVGATQWPERAVVVTLLLLPFLALARRLLLEFTAWQSTDPLLLVAPAVLALILVRLFVFERRELARDRISKVVLVVMLLTLLQVANPRGSGLAAGLAALLFTAVPLAWYFVGRELTTPRAMRALFGGLVIVGCVVAVYGLNQTWNGMPSWDLEWVRQTGYASLHIGDVIRAFGTFSSAAEYAAYLGIAIVVSVAFALRGTPQFLPAVPLLAVAIFYESGRGIVVATSFAVIVVIAARSGSLRRTVTALVVCLVATVLAFTFARGFLQERAASSSDPLVSHQLGGLSDPFNEDESTLPTHLAMFENGVREGVLDPVGHGITSTTLAGETLGNGEANTTTEVDISNAFVSLGTFGGVAYLALVLLVLMSALRLAVHRRDAVSLAALGVLVLALGQWLNGGYYAVSPLVWVTAGFVVACERRG